MGEVGGGEVGGWGKWEGVRKEEVGGSEEGRSGMGGRGR